jgi:hypothetical protein
LTKDIHFRDDVQEGLLDIPLILLQSFFIYSSICVSVGSTVVLRSITMRGFLVIISTQV